MFSAEGINWDAVVTRNRGLLTRIVDMLFSLVIGLDEGKAAKTLPRCTRNHIYRILRPAESALRRLIMIAARDIEPAPLPPCGGESENPGLATAKHLVFARGGAAMATSGTNCKMITINLGLAGMGPRPKPKRKAPQQTANTRPPVFPLIDPLKHFHFGPRRRVARSVPRITWMDGRDLTPLPEVKLPEPGDPVDATRLCRRLIALKNALENLDEEARRLARWKARRAAGRVKRLSPMRPGYPPGRRKRHAHEIDEILKDLHSWAQYSEETNTS